MKPKSKRPSSHVAVHINLSDGECSEMWSCMITAAIEPGIKSLDVFFIGGGAAVEPSALISLRNTLLLVPSLAGHPVFIRTFATSSLPPFSCIAWLVGDERWIAKDARVWIPDVPEVILRGKQHPSFRANAPEPQAPPAASDERDDALTDDADEEHNQPSLNEATIRRKSSQKDCKCHGDPEECACGRTRILNDLRTMADVINEWFPSWEYSGRGISTDELLEMRIIKPDWIFAGSMAQKAAPRHVDDVPPAEPAATPPTELASNSPDA
jgi:hypothetical protein